MRKLYFSILMVCLLLSHDRLSAQCSVYISTDKGISQLNCTVKSIILTANASGTGMLTYSWGTNQPGPALEVSESGTYTVSVNDEAGCTTSSSIIITKDVTAPTVSALVFPDKICSGSTAILAGLGAVTYSWEPGSQTGAVVQVKPAYTTTYTVTGTASNGCTGTATVQLAVNPLPTASIDGNTTVCQNAPQPLITFTALSGMPPYTFGYVVNGGPVQTIATKGTDKSVALYAPTGILDTLVYKLVSIDGNGCTQSQDGTATVTVLTGPSLKSPKTASVCNNKPFLYTAESSVPGTRFNWTRPLVAGISNPVGNGTSADINDTLVNTTPLPIIVNYIFSMSTGSGCVTAETVKVTVNPTPVINPLSDATFCNGVFVSSGIPLTSESPGVSFNWTNSNQDIGLPSTGSGNIFPFTATNPSDKIISAIITVFVKAGADSCEGKSTTFTIFVRPAPVLISSKDTIVCNGVPFSYLAKSSAEGTSFQWTRAADPGNLADGGSTATINETLTNTTTLPVVVTYIFTLSTGTGCSATRDSLKVMVNPTAGINQVNDTTFCNGVFVSRGIPFTSKSPDVFFSWVNSNSNIGLPSSGSGNIPPFTATNTTNNAVTDTITVTVYTKAGVNSCAGTDTTFTITVRPAPIFTSIKDTSVCNNILFSYIAKSSDTGTIYSWARASVAGIADLAASGSTADISETLSNITPLPIVASYFFRLSVGTGCVTTDTVKVTVNPTAEINPVNDTTFCNGVFVRAGIPFTSKSPSASFSWTNSNPAIGLPSSGSGNILPFTATNASDKIISAIINVFVKAGADSCEGKSTTFTIFVRPAPVLISSKDTIVCNKVPFSYLAKSSAEGTSFQWTRAADPGNPASSGSTASINETLTNTTTLPVVVTYIFTLTGNGIFACETKDTVKVTVNPTPAINQLKDTTFCNGVFVSYGIALQSNSPNVLFSWTNTNRGIGLADSGRGNIPAFNATNNTNDSIKATIKVTAYTKAGVNSCAGTDTTFTITVRPAPIFTSIKDTSVCNNILFSYIAKSSSAQTNFSWIRAADSDNPADSGSTAIINNDMLKNNSSQPRVVKYSFDLFTDKGCKTTKDSLLVTINPTPKINPIDPKTFCKDSVVQPVNFISPTNNLKWNWLSDQQIGFGLQGTGNFIPAFVARISDTASVPINAKITVIAGIGNSCIPDTVIFPITILPKPVLISPKNASVCNNTLFNYTAMSSAAQTNFSWTRAADSDNQARNGSTATINNDTLKNNSSQPVVVKYYFKLYTGIGCETIDSVLVTVNPTPVINRIDDTIFCNGTYVNGIKFSPPDIVSFTWKCDTTIGFGVSGSDSIPAFTATNNGTTAIVANVTVSIATRPDQCKGSDSTFTITVNPSPAKPSFTSLFTNPDNVTLSVCNGAQNINFNVNSPAKDVSYRWTSTGNSTAVYIRNTHDSNTVISFGSAGKDTIILTATSNTAGSCNNIASQIVQVKDQIIEKPKSIILDQPGNLLIYPDNSLAGYQWGYDYIIKTLSDSAFGRSIPVQGQVYQFFIPDTTFIDINSKLLNNTKYLYWVLLQYNGCYTRAYYKGPYANRVIPIPPAVDSTVTLQVIPNPNKGAFEISLKGNIYGNIHAKIHNAKGQVVFMKDFVKTTSTITEKLNTANLPGGLYFIVLYNSGRKPIVSRFIIQR